MTDTTTTHAATLWMVNDIPTRMVYADRRWRITDTPTRLRESVWALPIDGPRGMYGWRFQATDDTGISIIFDVYRTEDGWHVHHAYE